ncbi:TetR/AcrR family transcriptional regulator [Leucobacter iarius]|uniref:HTH tetR-type domain-containing protein n=1 Tax=Leucobacter iarius TaxID=333963 RepID=A0ABN2LSM7_9MICO
MPPKHEPPSPRRSTRARGALDRASIAAAAIELVEQLGIERLTMRALATELDCGTMTLYTHVRNRDDLLTAIVEQLIAEVDADRIAAESDGTWRGLLSGVLDSYRALAMRHPRSFELLALAPYDLPPVAPHLEGVVAALERTGLSADEARTALGLADAFATGFLVVWARTTTREETPGSARTAAALGDLRAPEMYDRGVAAVLLGFEATRAGSARDSTEGAAD